MDDAVGTRDRNGQPQPALGARRRPADLLRLRRDRRAGRRPQRRPGLWQPRGTDPGPGARRGPRPRHRAAPRPGVPTGGRGTAGGDGPAGFPGGRRGCGRRRPRVEAAGRARPHRPAGGRQAGERLGARHRPGAGGGAVPDRGQRHRPVLHHAGRPAPVGRDRRRGRQPLSRRFRPAGRDRLHRRPLPGLRLRVAGGGGPGAGPGGPIWRRRPAAGTRRSSTASTPSRCAI